MTVGIKNCLLISLALVSLLSGCSTFSSNANHFAPVTNGWSTDAASSSYRVQPDDTLYSIAFRYGTDYRKLAELNHLSAPYHLVAGQNLMLTGSEGVTNSQGVVTAGAPQPNAVMTVSNNSGAQVAQARQQKNNAAASESATPTVQQTPIKPKSSTDKEVVSDVSKWLWPADGKVTQGFSSSYGANKGIDISGRMGAPVRATAAGKVVYSGQGLKGYGLLIIIKHNAEYLSAYAHNSQSLVKEGDVVKSGQKIALMGDSGASKVTLHFEIRKAGKPVDPLSLLSPKK